MRKVKGLAVAVVAVFLLVGVGVAFAEAPYHIGIVTGTVSQGEDELRGAERLIEEYGSATNGGIIQHITYPDNFMQEMETAISQIAGLSR